MRRIIFLGALLVGSGASAQTITDAPSFEAAIKAARAATDSTDQFAEVPKNDLAGKPFKLTLTLGDDSSAGYQYSDGVLTLNISPTSRAPLSEMKRSVPTLKVSSSRRSLGSYTGQNAYGATATVRSSEWNDAAIAIVDSPKFMPPPEKAGTSYAKYLPAREWWVQLTLPPSEAKAISNDTVAVLEGTYADLPYKKYPAGACSFSGSEATITSPYEVFIHTCFVGAKVARVAFVRKSSGAVIKEWTLENAPRLGPVLWDKIRVGMTEDEVKLSYPDLGTNYANDPFTVETDPSGGVKRVEVKARTFGLTGKKLAKQLTVQYGAPLRIDCQYDLICKGEWRVNGDVVAYLDIMGDVKYQLATDDAPIGF